MYSFPWAEPARRQPSGVAGVGGGASGTVCLVFPTNTMAGMADSNLGSVAAAGLVIVAFGFCVTH